MHYGIDQCLKDSSHAVLRAFHSPNFLARGHLIVSCNEPVGVHDLPVQRSPKILGVNLIVRILFLAAIEDSLDETVVEVVIGPVMAHQHAGDRSAVHLSVPDQQTPLLQQLFDFVFRGSLSDKSLVELTTQRLSGCIRHELFIE